MAARTSAHAGAAARGRAERLNGHPRRGDAGRGASSARARHYALDLAPLLDTIAGEVGRTTEFLAQELTRRGIAKPRGGTVWTPADVRKLLHRLDGTAGR